MSERSILSSDLIAQPALAAMQSYHADIVAELKSALEHNPIVIVGMATNPSCRKARQALDEAGIAYKYLEYGGYLSQWRRRLAIKLWSGWPTFPQVFVHGALIGGNRDLRAALADGSLRQRLENNTQVPVVP